MEFVNYAQLGILVVIIALLITQKVVINKGMMVEAHYSATQRLAIGITIAAIPFIWGILSNQYFMVLLGIGMGVACYRRKSWYKFK